MASFLSTLGSVISKSGFWLRQHSPELLTIGGVVFETAATVTACVATAKAVDVVKEAKEKIEELETTDCDDEEKNIRSVRLKTVGKLAALYAPAIGLSISGGACILYGTHILNNRNAALAIGMAGLAGEFNEYRSRAREMFGDDVDLQLRHGLKTIESKSTVIDDNGKKKTVKTELKVVDDVMHGNYTRIYDCTNPHWNECFEYNLMFLRAQQYYFNDLLRANGHVYLNEVLKSLGFKVTRTGHETGWTYNPNDPRIDNYIDFRLCKVNQPLRDADGDIVGYKDAIALDFNVDGAITDKVDWDED